MYSTTIWRYMMNLEPTENTSLHDFCHLGDDKNQQCGHPCTSSLVHTLCLVALIESPCPGLHNSLLTNCASISRKLINYPQIWRLSTLWRKSYSLPLRTMTSGRMIVRCFSNSLVCRLLLLHKLSSNSDLTLLIYAPSWTPVKRLGVPTRRAWASAIDHHPHQVSCRFAPGVQTCGHPEL